MSAIVSYTSFDYQPITIVPVIASFDTDGHIAPLYVRIDGVALSIARYWVKASFGHTCTFQCQVERNQTLFPLLLTYYQTEGVWAIPK